LLRREDPRLEFDRGSQLSNVDQLTKSLLDLAIESWRISRRFERLLLTLDAGEQSRYQGQLRWFQRKVHESLTESGLRIENAEGQQFDPGMAATPLNIEDFKPEDTLVVDQMIEPIVMGADGVIRTGTVMLKRMNT